MNIDKLVKDIETEKVDNTEDLGEEVGKTSVLNFGPSKTILKSYNQWEGCDGEFFYPYNKTAKLGKICDFSV